MPVGKWNDDALRHLWEEYKRTAMTQKQLGQKYGLTRYKMRALLNLAREKFSPAQPDYLASGLNWKTKSAQSAMKEIKS